MACRICRLKCFGAAAAVGDAAAGAVDVTCFSSARLCHAHGAGLFVCPDTCYFQFSALFHRALIAECEIT